MSVEVDSLGRIAKLFIDRDNMSLEEATHHLSQFRVLVRCGHEIGRSANMQAAVLTAVNIASRCFPGSVRVVGVGDEPVLVPWTPGRSCGDAIREIGGAGCLAPYDDTWSNSISVAFGTVGDGLHGVQATFDGWTCAVSPLEERLRLPEREGCILSGIAAGALSISEIFLGNFGCAIEAASRVTGLSLWRPDLPWDALDGAGVDAPLHHVPSEVWLLGLGHLGQAYAWSFSMLPFADRSAVNVLLQDYDRVVRANLDTGLLSCHRHLGRLKTRVVNEFVEDRGFRTRLIERRFDARSHVQHDEPRIMLAGMDGKGPRHLLDQAGLDIVVDCGVGGGATNFDSITLNVVPNGHTSAGQLWPVDDEETRKRREEEIERLATARDMYKAVRELRGCGHLEIAGRSVGVPFVGAIASTLALSEVIRRFMGAAQFDRIRFQLATPHEPTIRGGQRQRLRCPSQPAAEPLVAN